ncbi:hypothetical protein AsAng_0034980 [Aureispira anguillae]|uniref:Uncharacterized protein n=1 Tax=Aureispira anguillae TaxID=2864201 RepID=A0A915YGR2_9BACT|nr:hypothetical protein AsAng_0034980 [Aureispira anguillae]
MLDLLDKKTLNLPLGREKKKHSAFLGLVTFLEKEKFFSIGMLYRSNFSKM